MHALSLGTWWIHVASVMEWLLAIFAVQAHGRRCHDPAWNWFALAMVPSLVSAMAACTWHGFDNNMALQGLVVLQAACTVVGNGTLALAAWWLWRKQQQADAPPRSPNNP